MYEVNGSPITRPMKTHRLLPLLFLLTLSACGVYLFENPQPLDTKALNVIPAELTGTYLEKEDRDSLIITSHSYRYTGNESVFEETRKGTLESGKVVLKKVNGYYIINQKIANPLESSADSLWDVYALKYKRKRLSVYSLIYDEENSKQFADSVMGILPVKEQKFGEDTLYVINPTKKEYKKLLDSKLYRKVLEFKKIKK